MQTHVEFSTNAFYPNHLEIAEPDAYRASELIIKYISNQLCSRGYKVTRMLRDDFGWTMVIRKSGLRFLIGCGSYSALKDGFLCFVECHKSNVAGPLKKTLTSEGARAICRALNEILIEGENVRQLRWWTQYEVKSASFVGWAVREHHS